MYSTYMVYVVIINYNNTLSVTIFTYKFSSSPCMYIFFKNRETVVLRRSMDGTVEWFRSYLTGRNNVCVNGCCSSSQQPLQGVPQGSLLEPILFLNFVNDIPLSLRDPTFDSSNIVFV